VNRKALLLLCPLFVALLVVAGIRDYQAYKIPTQITEDRVIIVDYDSFLVGFPVLARSESFTVRSTCSGVGSGVTTTVSPPRGLTDKEKRALVGQEAILTTTIYRGGQSVVRVLEVIR